MNTNHFPLKINFEKSHVYSYHLEIKPDIPEDSRQLRQLIISGVQEEIMEKLKCEHMYTSGMTVFASNKVENDGKTDNLTFETKQKVNGAIYTVKLTFDHQIDLNLLYSKDEKVNKQPAIQFIDIYVKSLMRDMKFNEIGRNS